MTTVEIAASVYSSLALVVVLFQLALMLGAPLGAYTLAGWNFCDLPERSYWIVLAVSFITFVANSITPSLPERRLWSLVTAIMLCAGTCLTLIRCRINADFQA